MLLRNEISAVVLTLALTLLPADARGQRTVRDGAR